MNNSAKLNIEDILYMYWLTDFEEYSFNYFAQWSDLLDEIFPEELCMKFERLCTKYWEEKNTFEGIMDEFLDGLDLEFYIRLINETYMVECIQDRT